MQTTPSKQTPLNRGCLSALGLRREYHLDFQGMLAQRRRSTLEFQIKKTAPYLLGSTPYVANKHVAVKIGTVSVGKTVSAAGAPKANGLHWNHILDKWEDKCARDQRVRAPHTPKRGPGCPYSTTAGRPSKTGAVTNLGGMEDALRSRKHSTVSAAASWWTNAMPKISRS